MGSDYTYAEMDMLVLSSLPADNIYQIERKINDNRPCPKSHKHLIMSSLDRLIRRGFVDVKGGRYVRT